MNKIHILIIAFLASFAMNAQSYIGFLTDNYSGVNNVISNPANIVDSRLKVDVNLAGASVLLGNDYLGVKLTDVFDDEYDLDDALRSPEDENTLFGNIDILGPSFSISLNEKNAIAIFTRARAFVNINNISGDNISTLEDGFDDSQDFLVNEDAVYASANIWSEIGLSYARVLLDKEVHFLKGGISLKYIAGLGNAYAVTDNFQVDFDADGIQVAGNTFGSVDTNGTLTYGFSENFDDDIDLEEIEIISSGFGIDLGFTYEWRPKANEYTYTDVDGNTSYFKDVNKYKLKLGVSVTDIGSINYEGNEELFDINGLSVTQNNFENIEDIEDFENTFNVIPLISENESTSLPTALHVNADWNINDKFYLNLNTDLSLVDKEQINQTSIANIVTLTPRYERKWFTFQAPVSIQQYSGFQVGAGLRAGPLYLGSGSLITALLDDEAESADIYLGIKVPIYQSRPKDKDGDGVPNKIDNCPKEAGTAENNGCPWGDADNDGVLDNLDECPNKVGPKETNGCPRTDQDKDGLLDKNDKCPTIAGPFENNGCPWADTDGDGITDNLDKCPNEFGPKLNNGCSLADQDKDGILDKDDKCPTIAGVKENNGCPNVKKVTSEVIAKLNSYSKTILFDSGKSTIKAQSNSILNDIVNILKEYPNSKFNIEGHTDSAGNNTLNKNLSESRASAVKVFLIENGINQSRLTSTGYGEEQPITTNTTKEGRALNRRVEINLIK